MFVVSSVCFGVLFDVIIPEGPAKYRRGFGLGALQARPRFVWASLHVSISANGILRDGHLTQIKMGTGRVKERTEMFISVKISERAPSLICPVIKMYVWVVNLRCAAAILIANANSFARCLTIYQQFNLSSGQNKPIN